MGEYERGELTPPFFFLGGGGGGGVGPPLEIRKIRMYTSGP